MVDAFDKVLLKQGYKLGANFERPKMGSGSDRELNAKYILYYQETSDVPSAKTLFKDLPWSKIYICEEDDLKGQIGLLRASVNLRVYTISGKDQTHRFVSTITPLQPTSRVFDDKYIAAWEAERKKEKEREYVDSPSPRFRTLPLPIPVE